MLASAAALAMVAAASGSDQTSYQMAMAQNLIPAGGDASASQSMPESIFFDTESQFEVWLRDLRRAPPLSVDHNLADFIVECDFGSDCEIWFDGVLYLEGLLSGSIRSESGTLVTGPGSIEAKIDVGTAIVNNSGAFNITASERVLLRNNVRVTGKIRASFVAIREGATFAGDCFLEDLTRVSEPAPLPSGKAAQGVLTASAGAD